MFTEEGEISTLLGRIYDAAGDPTLWAPFIEELAGRTKSNSAALLVQVFDQGLYSLSNSWRLPEEFVRTYQEYYHGLDVWAEVVLSKPREYPSAYVCTSQSLCPLPQLKKTEFYNDSLVHGGIEHGMFALLENSKSCLASVCLYRDRSGTEFAESELKILQFLGPHLKRAFSLHLKLSQLKSRSEGAESALDMLPTGVVFLGSKGEIILMNRSAAACVAESDGLLATRDGLRAERPGESSLLGRTVEQAVRTSNGSGVFAGGTVFVSRRMRSPLQVQISPIHNSLVQTSQKVAAVAFINDPLQARRPTKEVLHMLYGFTPAECRVALLLSDGRAPQEIAKMLSVTQNTVRSQIKSIFSKTGVRRQGELIRLLLHHAEPTIQPQPTAHAR
jgi:DNA-binding CsgD family transcriptional regulator